MPSGLAGTSPETPISLRINPRDSRGSPDPRRRRPRRDREGTSRAPRVRPRRPPAPGAGGRRPHDTPRSAAGTASRCLRWVIPLRPVPTPHPGPAMGTRRRTGRDLHRTAPSRVPPPHVACALHHVKPLGVDRVARDAEADERRFDRVHHRRRLAHEGAVAVDPSREMTPVAKRLASRF